MIRIDVISMLETASVSVVPFDRADATFVTEAHPGGVAAIFADFNLCGTVNGLELAREINQADPSIAVVVTSGELLRRPGAFPPASPF